MSGSNPNPPAEITARHKGRILVAIAVAILLVILLGGAVTGWLIFRKLTPPVIVASYQADYQEGIPKPGWRYLWTPTGEIGNTNNYRDLLWNGQFYGFDDNPTLPRPNPAHYLRMGRTGGHPGHGKPQRGDIDTYVIAAFSVGTPGVYLITNSVVGRSDGKLNGNVNLRVYINDEQTGPEIVSESKEGKPFDRLLGSLRTGDSIFVAVGPNGMDRNDHFKLDFAIARRPR